jgi:serine/threonine protein kinase/ActR/RegA family two-component response regulator
MIQEYELYNQDEEEYEDNPMALIVEDEKFNQEYLRNELKKIGIDSRIATTVKEAIDTYHDLERNFISVDVLFLDIILRDGSRGTEFLRMIRENKWMEKAMIIVMSGVDELDIIKECHELKCQNFIHKPIAKNTFVNESCKILRHLDSLKCPLNKYKIEKTLGTGAFGVVELIRHKKTKELYALKTIKIDPQGNYQKELNFNMLINCPLILKLIEYKIIEDNVYLVLEYAEFGTVSHNLNLKIETKSNFEHETILNWMTELFIGLFEIHDRNVMHRDIKSDNLLICKNSLLKIGDFGIARATEYNKAITVVGTFYYRAPEITHYKEYSTKIDIWSAGVVLYELIMKRVPFEGESKEIMRKIDSMEYDPVPDDTDPRLKNLLSSTLIYNPEERLSALQILKKDFMLERVKKLFDTGIIEDNELYSKLIDRMSHSIFSINQTILKNDSKPIIIDENMKNYFEYFKTALKLESNVMKTSFKPGVFSSRIYDIFNGEDIKLFAEDYKISIEEIQKLIDKKLLIAINNEDSIFNVKNLYQIKLFDDVNIDNSIVLPIDNQSILIIEKEPIILSLLCLKQIMAIKNKVDEIDEDSEIQTTEILNSEEYLEFMLNIKKLKFLKFQSYTSAEKLATILNIYQTMYIHLSIKRLITSTPNRPGLIDTFKSVFRKTENPANNIVYEIGGHKLSLYEMKHIVIRRNKKPVGEYFRLVYDNDPRISLINESDNMLLKLHIICPDPNDDNDISFTPIKFNEKVYDQLDTFCKTFISETIHRENEILNVPIMFKTYINDIAANEVDMIKCLLRYHSDTSLKPTYIAKMLTENSININYY